MKGTGQEHSKQSKYKHVVQLNKVVFSEWNINKWKSLATDCVDGSCGYI